jgi:hypothetical protein
MLATVTSGIFTTMSGINNNRFNRKNWLEFWRKGAHQKTNSKETGDIN